MKKTSLLTLLFCVGCVSNRPTSPVYVPDSSYGVRVETSPLTQWITQTDVDGWCAELVFHWKKHLPEDKILVAINKWRVLMRDDEVLPYGVKGANGLTYLDQRATVIATKPSLFVSSDTAARQRIAALFKHELSHAVATYAGRFPDAEHHQVFHDLGLPF